MEKHIPLKLLNIKLWFSFEIYSYIGNCTWEIWKITVIFLNFRSFFEPFNFLLYVLFYLGCSTHFSKEVYHITELYGTSASNRFFMKHFCGTVPSVFIFYVHHCLSGSMPSLIYTNKFTYCFKFLTSSFFLLFYILLANSDWVKICR